MGRIFAILACSLILGPISAGEAQAQTDDHLKCYKIKDDVKLKGTLDLDGKQFGLEQGCKISKAKMFCVPATKLNVKVQAKNDDGPVLPLPISGPPAPGDRICYKIKCPDPQPQDQTVSDQFGTHNLTKFKAFMLCTPAGKFTYPPTPCDLSGYPTCGGDCTDPTQTCHPANDGTTKCLCEEPCGFDAQGICGGDCAVAVDTCQLNSLTGKCDCGSQTEQCTDTQFPTCAGPCPNPLVCLPKLDGTNDCDCLQEEPDVCDFDTTGTCGGPCPMPGETCVESPPGTCACQPTQQEVCEDFPSNQGLCGGSCPTYFTCDDDTMPALPCKCFPTEPCGSPLYPTCQGFCQVGEVCVNDPSLGCRCQ